MDVSFDRTNLASRGIRPVKQMLFLMAARTGTLDGAWAQIYQRLLPRLAIYDELIKDSRGKLKVLGRMAWMIFALLKTDQELLSQIPPGETPLPPMLYDPEIHRMHQGSCYRSLKPGTQPGKLFPLPNQQ